MAKLTTSDSAVDIAVAETPAIVVVDGDEAVRDLLAVPSRHDALRALGGVRVYSDGPPDSVDGYLERIGNSPVVMFGWPLPTEVLTRAPKLGMLAYLGTGAANFVDLSHAAEATVTVTNTPAYGAPAVAEHTLALTLAHLRNIPALDASMRRGEWAPVEGEEIRGKTVGIVGLGPIGMYTARLFSAFGARVVAWNRTAPEERAAEVGAESASLDELFTTSDIVTLHLALNEATQGIIDESLLDRLSDGALLVNTARGELVDVAALARAIETGRIRTALDVFETEPMPRDNVYARSDATVITPHVGYATPGAVAAMVDIAVSNAAAYLRGSPKNVVT